MLNSTLIEILKSFSKDELKSFEEFVESPFHNKKTPAIKLFKYLKKHSPDFNNPKLQRESAWNFLFPDKEYNYGVMKNLIHDLTKLSEDFISISGEKNDPMRKEYNIIKFLNDKKKYKLAEKYLDKTDTKIKDSTTGDSDYYKNIFNIEKVRLSILYSRISDKHKLNPGAEFEQSSKYLIESFLISILENYVLINSLNKVHKSGFGMPLLEEVLAFVKSNESFLENFYIKTYYYILLLDREQDEKFYFALKKILTEIDDSVAASFKYALWENISNYITFRFHAGEKGIMREQFDLYKLYLNKKIYYAEDESNFFIVNFTTFFNVAVGLNELDWAEDFLNQYAGKLDENAREDVKNYCHASICIKKKDFLKANEYLSKVKKLHEPHMKAGLKLGILIVYYELGWYESSISVIDSFKHLLDNEKNIQEVIKEKHRKFIKGYSMLIDIIYKKDDSAKLKLIQYLEKTEGIGSSPWLKRKAGELGIEF
ncbi:MAG: hypothetical protein IPL53_00835 [Ignavibacteria bacterium]|nr:hypothetical protein [Ignavibacteria bacterium]